MPGESHAARREKEGKGRKERKKTEGEKAYGFASRQLNWERGVAGKARRRKGKSKGNQEEEKADELKRRREEKGEKKGKIDASEIERRKLRRREREGKEKER